MDFSFILLYCTYCSQFELRLLVTWRTPVILTNEKQSIFYSKSYIYKYQYRRSCLKWHNGSQCIVFGSYIGRAPNVLLSTLSLVSSFLKFAFREVVFPLVIVFLEFHVIWIERSPSVAPNLSICRTSNMAISSTT